MAHCKPASIDPGSWHEVPGALSMVSSPLCSALSPEATLSRMLCNRPLGRSIHNDLPTANDAVYPPETAQTSAVVTTTEVQHGEIISRDAGSQDIAMVADLSGPRGGLEK